MMNEGFGKPAEETAALQKGCLETISRMMQAAFTRTPNFPPPEIVRQNRSGILLPPHFAGVANTC